MLTLRCWTGRLPAVSGWRARSVKVRKIARAQRACVKLSQVVCLSEANTGPGCSQTDGLQLALKEWAVTCAALGQGDQTVILRKGGIREPTFQPAAETFLLFPTSFHSKANLLTFEANDKYQQAEMASKAAHHRIGAEGGSACRAFSLPLTRQLLGLLLLD
ncbi:hypothetical protein ABBQ38_000587 [Trebouxia sp. C0009 RCD-2024]